MPTEELVKENKDMGMKTEIDEVSWRWSKVGTMSSTSQ
jgi:hypothetical protein